MDFVRHKLISIICEFLKCNLFNECIPIKSFVYYPSALFESQTSFKTHKNLKTNSLNLRTSQGYMLTCEARYVLVEGILH